MQEPMLPSPESMVPVEPGGYVAPEQVPITSAENAPNVRPEQPHEGVASGAQAQSTQADSAQQATPVPTQVAPAASPMPQGSSSPIVADDVDVIEKEWVDKAKKIVGATSDDPYKQESEVSKLQAEYLQKRYNKQIKLAE